MTALRHIFLFLLIFSLFYNRFFFFLIRLTAEDYNFKAKTLMKKTYHLCLSSKNEILFRCEEDFIRGINCLCLTVYRFEASLSAYVFMSNHVHICIRAEDPDKLIRAFWYMYTRYFNSKYGRYGHLGESDSFKLEIEGLYHLLTAIAYILRNPMHHGVTGTPFGYPYSSIRALFRKDFGWENDLECLPEKSEYRYLPRHQSLPESFRMDKHGMIMPECAIDVADVEHQFSTARSFLYYMNRLSGEKWEEEQSKDSNGQKPVTLSDIENENTFQDIKVLLINEHGRSNYNAVTDVQLCEEIDTDIVPRLGKRSVYELTQQEKKQIAIFLMRKYHVPAVQVLRCLALHDE